MRRRYSDDEIAALVAGLRAAPPTLQPDFNVGERVRLAAGGPGGTVREVATWPRVTAYRVSWDHEPSAVELWLGRELRPELTTSAMNERLPE